MAVTRIERIKGGAVVGAAATNSDGFYECLERGKNVDPIKVRSLDDVAAFLRAHPQSGVRMNPRWGKIVKNIYIDGVPR